MIGFISQLISMSVQAALIITLVVLCRFILIKCGVPKKFIMILWIIPFFFLVCPWKISVPYSMPGNIVSDYSQKAVAELFSKEQDYFSMQQMGAAPVIIIGESGEVTSDYAGSASGDGSTAQSLTTSDNLGAKSGVRGLAGIELVAVIWGIGIIAIIAYSIHAYISLKKQLICRLSYEENIYFADDIATPLVLGVVKPCIYIPSSMADEYLEYVINHEKTHIRRCDHVVKLIFFIITAFHWFNPFAWAAYMLMCSDMEMACDEMTIQVMGMDSRAEYANALLQISAGNGNKKKLMLGAPLAFSEGDTKDRIKNALKYKQIAGIAAVTVVIIGIGITVLFLTESDAKADVGNDISETENTDEEIETTTAFLNADAIDLHTFMGLELPEGYYFSEYSDLYGISGGELILPMAYEVYGDGENFTPKYWRSAGSIGTVSSFFFTFENGKLGTNIPYGNHQEEEFVEYIENEGAWQALLAHYNFDLYTAAQYEELAAQGIVPEEDTSDYWYVFFVNENEDMAYYISLSTKRFTKEDAISMAMQVLRD